MVYWDDQDALALESQKRAVAAIESGRFKGRDCSGGRLNVKAILSSLIQMNFLEKMLA